MKKWISCLLAAAILVVTMGAHTVSAATTETTAKTADQKFEMKTSSSSLNTGDTVVVTFHIHGGEASGFVGYLNYDPTVLRIMENEISPEAYSYTTIVDGKPQDVPGNWQRRLYENNRLEVRSEHGGVVMPEAKEELVLTIPFRVQKSVASVNIGLENLWVDRDEWGNGMVPESSLNLQIVNSKAKSFLLGTDKVSGYDSIAVPVKFTSKDRFSTLELSVSFDTTKLMFDSVTLPDEFRKNVTYSVGLQSGAKVTINFDIDGETSGSNKTLCFLNFLVVGQKSGVTGTGSTSEETITWVDLAAEEVKNQANDVFVLDEAKASCQVTITKKNQSTGTRSKLVIIGTDPVSGSETIAVPVKLMINEGFSALGISVTFDPAKLAYDSLRFADVYGSTVQLDSYTISQTGAKLTLNLAGKGDVKTTGPLMYLNFRVLEPSADGTGTQTPAAGTGTQTPAAGTTPVVLNVETVDNLTASELQYAATTTCTVTITEKERLLGDVNGDDRVNLIDLGYALQYYNDERALTNAELWAVDVNKNGRLDIMDALLILRYCSGELGAFS